MARRRLKTSNLQEIRESLTRVINMVYSGELDAKAANTIILGCNSILSTIKNDDIGAAADWKRAIIKIAEKRKNI